MTFLRSLSNRMFAAGALLAVVPLGIAIWSVTAAVTAQAERELVRGLEEAATLMEENWKTLFEHFDREARLIADLSRLKAIVELNDPPTAAPVAQAYREIIAADVLILTHRTGTLLAHAGGAGLEVEELASRAAIREAASGRKARAFWGFPGGILQVASVPIWIDPAHPEILGTITVGSSLNQEAAQGLKNLTNSDIAFAIDGEIKAATRPRGDWPALARHARRREPDRPARQRRVRLAGQAVDDGRGSRGADSTHPALEDRAAQVSQRGLHGARRDGARGGAGGNAPELRRGPDDYAAARRHHGHDARDRRDG